MTGQSSVGVVILAAGASRRLGRPKQTVMLGGETLLDRAVRIAREAGTLEIVVVLGAFAAEIRHTCRLMECRVALNPDWQEGMSGSIRTGIAALGPVAGAILMTCDMPLLTADHLRRLAAGARLTASRYGGVHGVPAYFPADCFQTLGSLHGHGGAKELLRSADVVDLAGAELDVDTAEDVRKMLSAGLGPEDCSRAG